MSLLVSDFPDFKLIKIIDGASKTVLLGTANQKFRFTMSGRKIGLISLIHCLPSQLLQLITKTTIDDVQFQVITSTSTTSRLYMNAQGISYGTAQAGLANLIPIRRYIEFEVDSTAAGNGTFEFTVVGYMHDDDNLDFKVESNTQPLV